MTTPVENILDYDVSAALSEAEAWNNIVDIRSVDPSLPGSFDHDDKEADKHIAASAARDLVDRLDINDPELADWLVAFGRAVGSQTMRRALDPEQYTSPLDIVFSREDHRGLMHEYTQPNLVHHRISERHIDQIIRTDDNQ